MLAPLTTEPQCHDLEVLQAAERKLAECTDLHEVVAIRNEAEAFRAYAKARKLSLGIQNRAAKLKIQAERKLGEALRSLKLRGGDRKSNSHRESLKLVDMEVDRNESSRWQKEASAPEDLFQAYCNAREEQGKDISSGNFLTFLSKTQPRKGKQSRKKKASPSRSNEYGRQATGDLEEVLGHLDVLTRMFESISQRHPLEAIERREIPRYLKRIRALLVQADD